ncbi:MAG: tetratricopeptide repeat protein [Candidatus Cloacimonetes bacterium]|nr:tetratricopeptide repeat protein [Candidatus Cloacimonadota bacterium]HPM02212.1 tetratricopeptide repeat protein [Candidatus Cloacimonadota bacterium]
MKKSIILLILGFLMICSLIAKTEKVVIIGIDTEDPESRYVKTMLEKRDLDAAFKSSTSLEMVPMKESAKALKAENFKGLMKEMEPSTVEKIATQLNANMAVWMWIMKENQSSFIVTGKVMSMRTKEMININFTVTKNKDERMQSVNDNLLKKIADFASSETKKIFDIAEQNFNAKKYKEAEEMFTRLLEIDDKNVEVYYFLGMINYENNKFPKAVEFFNKTLEFDPNRENSLLFLSETYKKQGNLDKSIETLSKVANVKNDANLWLAIAMMHKDKSNFKASEEALDNALKIDTQNEKIHLVYAELTYDNKEYEKAIPHLEFITNLYPDNEEVGRKLAISYQKTGQLDKAVENYKSLIAKDANNTRAYLNLGAAYRAMSFEKDAAAFNKLALDTYLTVQKLLPNSGKIDVSIADIYLNMNDLTKAENYANSAIKKDNNIHEPYVILGMINQKRGIAKHGEFVDLQKKTDSGNLYGAQLDQAIKNRDNAKGVANQFFKKADEMLKTARTKTDNPTTISDIDSKIQSNNQYINMTKKDFFN